MLIPPEPAYLTYRLHHDLGFAPNPFFGWCTLACCMPKLRRYAQVGDIVVGMAGQGSDGLGRLYPRLIYWMRVDEVLTFDGYWHDPRFARKRPAIPGPKLRMVGDRVYRHDEGAGQWVADVSMHHDGRSQRLTQAHLAKDTSVDRILVGRHFTYWGGSGPKLPEELIAQFPRSRNYKRARSRAEAQALRNFLAIDTPLRVVADPADWINPRYFPAA